MKKFAFIAVSFVLLFFISCSKEEDLNVNVIVDFEYLDDIDNFILKANVKSDNDATLQYHWTTSCDTIKIAGPNKATTFFKLPNISSKENLKVKLSIKTKTSSHYAEKDIPIPIMNKGRANGLGKELVKDVSNNKDYEWYYDQKHTGEYRNNNCGPTSVTMAIKWADKSFTKTPEQARDIYPLDGGWWYFDQIDSYLQSNSIKYQKIILDNIDQLKEEIDLGNIAIICLDMYYIRNDDKAKPNRRADKFYRTANLGWGHFIVAKGYTVVDETTFFEVYDPNSYDSRYTDGTLKGKNRYYRSVDLQDAITNWNTNITIVTKEQK